jgi:hypothetical protein
MAYKAPDRAIQTIRGIHDDDLTATGTSLDKAQRSILARTNPDVVATPSWKIFGPEARGRREALKASVDGRLQIFRDNIEAVTKTNRVLNNAAIIKVMTAAEQFIVEIRGAAEVEKHATLATRHVELLRTLQDHLDELKQIACNADPEFVKIVEARMEGAINEYAERCLKIAGLDFEFDKKKLLQLAA